MLITKTPRRGKEERIPDVGTPWGANLQHHQVLRTLSRGDGLETWPWVDDEIGSGTEDTEEALPGVCCLLTHPCEQRTPHSSGVVSHECNEDSTAWVYVPRFYGALKLFFKLRGERLE